MVCVRFIGIVGRGEKFRRKVGRGLFGGIEGG